MIIEATLQFTEENTAEAVKTASDGKSQLTLIQQTMPIVFAGPGHPADPGRRRLPAPSPVGGGSSTTA